MSETNSQKRCLRGAAQRREIKVNLPGKTERVGEKKTLTKEKWSLDYARNCEGQLWLDKRLRLGNRNAR